MPETNPQRQAPESDDALRRLVLRRAREINGKILTSLAIASDELDDNNYLGAIGSLDGLESEIQTMRSLLLLLR
ncbi:MAG: hypothetical protein WBE76_11920 [Terracidiphilus sp.]